MKEKIFIYGTGSIANVAYYYFKNESNYEVVAFVDKKIFIKKKKKFNLPVFEYEKIKKYLPNKFYKGFVAIGYKSLNEERKKIYNQLKKNKYKLVSFVSSHSRIASNVKIGDNCLILENQIIQPYSKIGNNVTIWCGNIIGHHCKINDNCFITSNVVIAGNSTIGKSTFIGIKTAIRDGVKIGNECVLFMNSSVGSNMKNKSTSIGELSKIYDFKVKNIQYLRKKYF